MFDKFGEFDSVEELNRAAAAQKAEGDMESLKLLAAENGISEYDVDDYINGAVDELANAWMAAIGKLKIEATALDLKGLLMDMAQEIMDMTTSVPELAKAIRKKDKKLAEYLALVVDTGWEQRVMVHKDIVKRTKTVKGVIGSHELEIGQPDRKTRKALIKRYYLGGDQS